jgi:hypothetical protein
MRGRNETARLPRAMHETKSATTSVNVNGEEPRARAASRFHTVWMAIEAKPQSSAIVTKGVMPAAGAGAAEARGRCCFGAPAAPQDEGEADGHVHDARREHHALEAEPGQQDEAAGQRPRRRRRY